VVLAVAVGAALLVASIASGQARKGEDSISAEQRKLQQTERQLREERRKAAEARARDPRPAEAATTPAAGRPRAPAAPPLLPSSWVRKFRSRALSLPARRRKRL